MKEIILLSTILFFSLSGFSQNFGVDKSNPTEKLDVNGYIKTSQGIKFADGSVQTTAGLPKSIIWSGGCNYHGTAGGWNTYCNNSVDFNTAAGYLSANGAGTFTVQKAGYYRINAWAISNGSGYFHSIFYHNGTYRQYQYEYVHGTWSDNFLEVTWPMNVGDTFYVRYYNPNGYGFHSWNANGAHSRLAVTYKGPLN